MTISESLVGLRSVGPDQAPEWVVEVTFANGSRRNALSHAMLVELTSVLDAAATDGCRALILRAEAGSRTWSAGHDIAELPTEGADAAQWENPLEAFLARVRQAPYPVIAAVEGGVWGGACDLVLTCDLVVATRTSTLAITPAKLGIPYSTAGVAHFVGTLPLNVAKEMFFTAEPITAEQAHAFGVVNRLVGDSAELEATAVALARRISELAPMSVSTVKAEMVALTDPRGLDAEHTAAIDELRRRAWLSDDYREGLEAFAQRRTPEFRGR